MGQMFSKVAGPCSGPCTQGEAMSLEVLVGVVGIAVLTHRRAGVP